MITVITPTSEITTGEIPLVGPTTLTELEQVIERGLRSFVEVGRALAEVRERRLYWEEYATFEAYCRERWGLGRSYAYEIIQAAEVAEVVSGVPDIPAPHNARVAVELAPLRDEPDEMRRVWTGALEEHGREPTAAQVREMRLRQPTADGGLDPRTGGQSQAARGRVTDFHAAITVIARLGEDHLAADLAAAPVEWQAEIRDDCRKAARALSRLGRVKA